MNFLDQANSFCRRLWRDESGVVLALTVVVFLTLFVIACSVYAVGENIRQRIELQNAADAAAYSAAVVQADALSRVAALNKAMAWTHYQLVNMEMDYIQDRWMRLVSQRWRSSYQGATAFIAYRCCWWNISNRQIISDGLEWVALNEARQQWDIGDFEGRLISDIASPGAMQLRIDAIARMNSDENAIILQLAGRIRDVVKANLQSNISGAGVWWRLSNPCDMWVRETQEPNLLMTVGVSGANWAGAGSLQNQWFPLQNNRIQRVYVNQLMASWNIFAEKVIPTSWWPKHTHSYQSSNFSGTVYGNDPINGQNPSTANYYATQEAKPYKLSDKYFRKSGGIVVGVAREQSNPLGFISGTGIYSFFDPAGRVSWALAAARAGYKDGVDGEYNPFELCIDGTDRNNRNKPWLNLPHRNLADVDWDAVLVPINTVWGTGQGAGTVVTEFHNATDWRSLDGTIADKRLFTGAAPNWSGLMLH